jgi:short-subunit dehydrogenase
MQIKDAVIIVTGASSGIGLSTVKALSQQEARVALLARSEKILEQLAKDLPNSLPVTVDMTKPTEIRAAIQKVYKHYGRIDGLINNAGRSYGASIEEIEPAIFDEIMHLNVLGPILAMQGVIPLMRTQGGGSIVNINSGTSFMVIPKYSVYSSSKRALVGFSLTARAELEKDNIVVSEIYPGITNTDFGKNRMTSTPDGGPQSDYSAGDSPDVIADLIIKALESGEAQYFANDYIKQLAGVAS